MKLIKKYPLITLFILGLLLRLSLLFFDYSWDVNNHIVWAKDLWRHGFRGFYETQSSEVYASLFPNYPPLSLFIFYIFYPLQSAIEKIAWFINITIPLFPSKLIFFIQSRAFLAAMLKLPAIFADLGIAWLCYLFAKRMRSFDSLRSLRMTVGNICHSQLITALVLFNPALFYNSALWGQIDSIPIFFVLLAIYSLLYSEKYLLSGFFFILGILTKPTALVFLPIYLAVFIKKFGLFNFLKSLILNLIIFYLSFIPFLKNLASPLLPFTIFSQKIMAAQSLPYVTNGAFNFWVFVTGFAGIKDVSPFLFGISYRFWGYFITGFFIVFIIKNFFSHSGERSDSRIVVPKSLRFRIHPEDSSRGTSRNDVFYSFFLIAFAAFLFLTKMHERYSMLPLPFLLLAAVKNKRLLKWFIVLSFISLLNLYHSWPVPKLGFITDIILVPIVAYGISFSNILIFIYSTGLKK